MCDKEFHSKKKKSQPHNLGDINFPHLSLAAIAVFRSSITPRKHQEDEAGSSSCGGTVCQEHLSMINEIAARNSLSISVLKKT